MWHNTCLCIYAHHHIKIITSSSPYFHTCFAIRVTDAWTGGGGGVGVGYWMGGEGGLNYQTLDFFRIIIIYIQYRAFRPSTGYPPPQQTCSSAILILRPYRVLYSSFKLKWCFKNTSGQVTIWVFTSLLLRNVVFWISPSSLVKLSDNRGVCFSWVLVVFTPLLFGDVSYIVNTSHATSRSTLSRAFFHPNSWRCMHGVQSQDEVLAHPIHLYHLCKQTLLLGILVHKTVSIFLHF